MVERTNLKSRCIRCFGVLLLVVSCGCSAAYHDYRCGCVAYGYCPGPPLAYTAYDVCPTPIAACYLADQPPAPCAQSLPLDGR